MFDTGVEEQAAPAAAMPWSRYEPDGLLAQLLAQDDTPGSATDAGRPGAWEGTGFWADETAAFEQVERIGAWERLIAWAQARQITEMAEFVGRAEARPPHGYTTGQAAESAATEIQLMLTLTAVTAAGRTTDAATLVGRFPATHAALGRGLVTLPKARVIADECADLEPSQAAAVEAAVLPKAPGWTTGQLRAALRREVLRTDPAAAARRHRRKRRERGITLYPERDGMATLSANLPAAEAIGCYAVLDEHARRAGTADDRTMDNRRADVLTDLILAGTGYCSAGTAAPAGTATPGENVDSADEDQVADAADPPDTTASQDLDPDRWPGLAPTAGAPAVRARTTVNVQVRVTVGHDTLRGLSDEPGELAGYGPITAAQARELAASGTWQRLVTDPLSGILLDHGTTRYRPPDDLAEYIRSRTPTCDHPGCRTPAHRCDLDHTIPYDPEHGTGPTSAANIGPRCRTHHRLKQLRDWNVTQDEDATVTWTTPSGHRYTTTPRPLPGTRRAPPPAPAAHDPGDDVPPF